MLKSRKQTLADRFLTGRLSPGEADELTDILENDSALLEELKFDLNFRAATSGRHSKKKNKRKTVGLVVLALLLVLLVVLGLLYSGWIN